MWRNHTLLTAYPAYHHRKGRAMSDPTAHYLFERGLLHKRNAERMLGADGGSGQEIVKELMLMVKYMEMGVHKQKGEIDEQVNPV